MWFGSLFSQMGNISPCEETELLRFEKVAIEKYRERIMVSIVTA